MIIYDNATIHGLNRSGVGVKDGVNFPFSTCTEERLSEFIEINHDNVVETIINHPIVDGLYHLAMVIGGGLLLV